ncbi:hypothetical protein EVAR_69546_1 [Eumeta japonica]|uniref:Uncharacterized protein n=1 Tax=Eumeta variegata TaxID=151549 RepID=A0A4C2A7F2_EUMVA|nr:hypothetical protein EVAR_69546_1 [Eumeta japonica]
MSSKTRRFKHSVPVASPSRSVAFGPVPWTPFSLVCYCMCTVPLNRVPVSCSAHGALPQDHASNTNRFLVISCVLHKWFVIDYVRTIAFVDQQKSLGDEDKRSSVDDNYLITMPLPREQLLPMMLLRHGNPEGFDDFSCRWHPLCLLAALDNVVKAFRLMVGAFMLQGVFNPSKSDTPLAPGRTDYP